MRDNVFALFRADWFGAHLRVFVVFVMEHHQRNHASAVLLIVDKLGPTIVPHAQSLPWATPFSSSNRRRNVDLTLEQRLGDGVPVLHHQSQGLIGLVETVEFARFRHLSTK